MDRRRIALVALAAGLGALGLALMRGAREAGPSGATALAPEGERSLGADAAVELVERPEAPIDALRAPEAVLEAAEPDPAAPTAPSALPDFVKKPAPGTYQGPWARDRFPSGAPRFEGQQVQREDGAWVLEGEWTAWHENGKVQERGSYRAHEAHGFWEWWDERGGRIARGSFVEGLREGPWTFWYRDGTKQMEAYYSAGEGDGRWVFYHENGRKAAEGAFAEGELSGLWSVWDEDGTLDSERTGLYELGERVGE